MHCNPATSLERLGGIVWERDLRTKTGDVFCFLEICQELRHLPGTH